MARVKGCWKHAAGGQEVTRGVAAAACQMPQRSALAVALAPGAPKAPHRQMHRGKLMQARPPEVFVGRLGRIDGAAIQVVIPHPAARQHHLRPGRQARSRCSRAIERSAMWQWHSGSRDSSSGSGGSGRGSRSWLKHSGRPPAPRWPPCPAQAQPAARGLGKGWQGHPGWQQGWLGSPGLATKRRRSRRPFAGARGPYTRAGWMPPQALAPPLAPPPPAPRRPAWTSPSMNACCTAATAGSAGNS